MKKFLLVFASGVMFTNLAVGQAKDNGIKINPLALLFGQVNVQYERAISASNSVQLGASYVSWGIGGVEFTGFGVSPEFRIYPSAEKEAMDGFYLAPLLSYNNVTVEFDDNKAALNVIGGGAKLGWNWLLGSSDSFIIDLGLGASFRSASANVKAGNVDESDYNAFSGFGPIINFSLGYAF